MKQVRAIALVAALTGSAWIGLTTPANAAFPGPDGRIAFTAIVGGVLNIATMNPDGSDETVLTHMSSGHWASEPTWSADGTTIAFDRQSYHRGNFKSQLWAMNADGSDQHPVLRDPFFVDFSPGYSPDGALIVFVRCRSDACAIYRVNSDGSGLTGLTHFKDSVQDQAPRYSPDGETIAFDSPGRNGLQWGVFLMDSDGSNIRRLTPKGLNGSSPDWSPDGSRIVFSSHCCGRRITAEVWIVNADGSGLYQVTAPGEKHDWYPVFSPSGHQIAFERYSSDFSLSPIWVVDADGKNAHRIHPNPAYQPAWGIATEEAS